MDKPLNEFDKHMLRIRVIFFVSQRRDLRFLRRLNLLLPLSMRD
jgi:hypothetical protein